MLRFTYSQLQKLFRSSFQHRIAPLKSSIYSTRNGFFKVALVLISSLSMGSQVARYGANALESYEVYVAASKDD